MSREERKGQNESWFRDVNERLEDRAALKRDGASAFEIVCECDREECTERIEITFAAYEAVRAVATEFIVVRGHADPGCELVDSSPGSYDVVTKLGDAAAAAEARDLRGTH